MYVQIKKRRFSRISIIQSAVLLLVIVALILSLTACDSGGASGSGSGSGGVAGNGSVRIKTDPQKSGISIFEDPLSNVEIYFFDVNNVPIDNAGQVYVETLEKDSDHILAADCYMIVFGDVEILVDAGAQSNSGYSVIADNCHKNLLPKIASLLSDDGILDYLIVTHADFDHISSLAVTNTILDAFCNNEKIIPINGDEDDAIRLEYIKNIIDFDSNAVRNANSNKQDESKLINSEIYRSYYSKRDRLMYYTQEEYDDAAYIPAATLFNPEDYDKDEDIFNKDAATPDKHIGSTYQTVLESKKYDLDKIKGSLVSVDSTSAEDPETSARYFYEIEIDDGAYLRILYNWYYDHLLQKATYDEQDKNNISVCFQVVYGDFKFMSLGDLGGDGENGLLNYYSGTDVLKNVTCYKSSHHGSINNGENSERLLAESTPQIVAITGVAVGEKGIGHPPRILLDKAFFDRVISANDSALVLCTNVAAQEKSTKNLIPSPFYGDIRVSAQRNQATVYRGYSGEVVAYTTEGSIFFKTVSEDGKDIISLTQTEWYQQAYKDSSEEETEK